MSEDKTNCKKCGATILQLTAEGTGGLCVPCGNSSEREGYGVGVLVTSAALTVVLGYLLFVHGPSLGPFVTLPLLFLLIIAALPLLWTAKQWRPFALSFSILKVAAISLGAYYFFQTDQSFMGVLVAILGVFYLLELIGNIMAFFKRRHTLGIQKTSDEP